MLKLDYSTAKTTVTLTQFPAHFFVRKSDAADIKANVEAFSTEFEHAAQRQYADWVESAERAQLADRFDSLADCQEWESATLGALSREMDGIPEVVFAVADGDVAPTAEHWHFLHGQLDEQEIDQCIEVCDYSHQCDGDDLNPAPAPTDEELHHEIATVCEQQPGTSWQSVADAVCWIGRDQPGWFYARRRIFRIVHQMASAGQLTLVRTKEQMTLSPAAAPA